jgi:UPF0176 protein
MDIQKVILYYGFTPVADPLALKMWQLTLCESLNLKGRVLISEHGINGTLGGNMADLKKYVRQTKLYPGFKKIDFKWSEGQGDEFPRLSVRVKKELVSFASPTEIQVDINGVVNGGKHLRPEEVNALVEERGDEVTFFDGRNAFEAKIGKFRGAIVPDTLSSHDFIGEIESGKYDHLKEKPVVTYCTGGIRCEILSAVMVNRGFKEVYQVKGGIVRYGEKYGNDGLWDGSLYIFDKRMVQDFSKDPEIIGECEKCNGKTKSFRNCANAKCHQLILLCDSCAAEQSSTTCGHKPLRMNHKDMVG